MWYLPYLTNGDKLESLLQSINIKFDIVIVSETWHNENKSHLFNPIKIEGYNNYEGQTGSSPKGGCGINVKTGINYKSRPDLDTKIQNGNSETEMKWIEIIDDKRANKIIGVTYRHPNRKDIDFQKLSKILQLTRKKKEDIHNW